MPDAKLDLYKLHRADYRARPEPSVLTVAPANYLTIDGRGAPDSPEFAENLGALYSIAYGMKMASKQRGRDYVVCKLEGLWWADGVLGWDFLHVSRMDWRWKLIIRTPEFITDEDRETALAVAKKKGKDGRIDAVRLETIKEGLCIQALHVGPYAEETPLIHRMHEAAQEQGYDFHGMHHEIYLSDPTRTAPEKLKTILRHPLIER